MTSHRVTKGVTAVTEWSCHNEVIVIGYDKGIT